MKDTFTVRSRQQGEPCKYQWGSPRIWTQRFRRVRPRKERQPWVPL